MIDRDTCHFLQAWFDQYVDGFAAGPEDVQKNIILKKKHSERVRNEIIQIGKILALGTDAQRVAEITALFHDLGRFEQYARYKTFVDYKSENHAELGVKILQKNNVFNCLPKDLADFICRVILYHNRARLPDRETTECLFHARMLRDADKLDIWKVVIDHYLRQEKEKNNAIELGLADTPGISDMVYDAVVNKSIVDARLIQNLNDFKVLQIGWVFDINFAASLQQVRSRSYVALICSTMPPSERLENIMRIVTRYIDTALECENQNEFMVFRKNNCNQDFYDEK
ncbi:MAG: HD domain-containing protein [Desulfotignum sp.]